MKKLLIILMVILYTMNIYSQEITKLDEKGNIIEDAESIISKYVEGEIIIKFKRDAIDEDIVKKLPPHSKFKVETIKKPKSKKAQNDKSIFQDYNGHSLRKVINKTYPDFALSNKIGLQRLMVLEVDRSKDIKKLIQDLSSYPEIEYAEPNFIGKLIANQPNDSEYFNNQKGFKNRSVYHYDMDIDAERAWDFSTGNSAIRVAVINNGVDYHHIDLGNGSFGTGAKVARGWDLYIMTRTRIIQNINWLVCCQSKLSDWFL
ncbi:MAG: hypothetical protein PHH37_13345 [Paludibacter sp.]|nr:hypothetical protein [Paludibacter sp.]